MSAMAQIRWEKEKRIDESVLKKNLSAFEKRYGYALKDRDDHECMYLAYEADNSEIYLCEKNGDSIKRLNSSYNPSYEAKKWAEGISYSDRISVFVLQGFSTGAYVRALLERFRSDTVIYVYEPDEVLFYYVCGVTDVTDIINNPRVVICFPGEENISGFKTDIISKNSNYRPHIRWMVTPGYGADKEFKEICDVVMESALAYTNYQKFRAKKALINRIYAWNNMRNGYFIEALKQNIASDMAAIIVSAGPSLNKNVDQLLKAKGKALVLCTDRAYEVLDNKGIIPDAIVSIDSEKSPEFITKAVDKNIPLICSYQVNDEIQKAFKGNCIYFNAASYEQEILGDDAKIYPERTLGGNVSGGAFIVCEILGIKKIVLIGQDLAYLDGKHHADDNEAGRPDIETVMTEGVYGGQVESNAVWLAFKDFFERRIVANRDLEVIDATEGGARIKGTTIADFSDVVDTMDAEYDVSGILAGLSYAQNEKDYHRTISVEKQWITDLEEIAVLSEKLKMLGDEIIGLFEDCSEDEQLLADKLGELCHIQEIISSKGVYNLLMVYWIEDRYYIPDRIFVRGCREENILSMESAIRYYEILPEYCHSLRDLWRDNMV